MKRKLKVLIVDDSLIMRQMITENLKELPLDIVGTAPDGQTALELFKKTQPDIVTLDITMPYLDGIEVLGKMKKINKDVKVMVITALKDKATGLEALHLGATSFINKPFNKEYLKSEFKRFLEKSEFKL
jgi:two-component system chemotaxis response regulator CheY